MTIPFAIALICMGVSTGAEIAVRIYQITKGCLFKGQLVYDVEDFKKTLKIDKKKTYENFNRISDKILNPSIAEINSKSDITVSYETIRDNRKVKTIKFIVKAKTNKKVSFNNFESREYDYDKLEAGLLGYEEVAIEDVTK